MKTLLALSLLFSLSVFAGDKHGDDCATCGTNFTGVHLAKADNKLGRAIASNQVNLVDNFDFCSPIEDGNFKRFKEVLDDNNLILEDVYFKIKCEGLDIMGMVIQAPVTRNWFAMHFQLYLKKKNKQNFFTKALLNEINTRNILKRLEITLRNLNDTLKGTKFEARLIKMKKKYTAYIKKFPLT